MSHKIVVVTPAGRRPYLELLTHYIVADESIDEWRLWDNCRTASDREYIHNLASRHKKIVVIQATHIDGSNLSISQFYEACDDSNTFYIKIDDDIVYLPPGFGGALYSKARSEADRYTWWSPLVVNNAICSWLLKYHSQLRIDAPLSASATCVHGWRSARFAFVLHQAFLEAVRTGCVDRFRVPDATISLSRFSINCVGFFGQLARSMGDSFCPSNVDDEEWISAVLPSITGLPGRIAGDLVIAHFSFFTQEDELIRTNILANYFRLAGLEPIAPPELRKRTLRQTFGRYVEKKWFSGANAYVVQPAEEPNFKGQSLRYPTDAPVVTRAKSVCAVVVTYNRKVMLAEGIAALLGQTRVPDQIVVIENCSTDGTLDYLQRQKFSDHPKVRVIQMPANIGGAGGFAKAAEYASESGFDWCWMMDDDVLPERDCLQNLLERGRGSVRTPARLSEPFDIFHLPARRFDLSRPLRRYRNRRELFQVSAENLADDRGCYVVEDFAFEGLLISSDTLRRAGLPRADFFINADDYEYALRLRKILDEKIWFVPSAIMHRQINTKAAVPGWKVYYSVRNRIIISKLYGENIIVRNEVPMLAIFRVLFDLLRLKTKDTRYMLWAIADGIRMKTCTRFLPPAAQSD